MRQKCSQSEFARLMGVDPSAVTYWKKRGLVDVTPDGKIDVEKSRCLLHTHRTREQFVCLRCGQKKHRDQFVSPIRPSRCHACRNEQQRERRNRLRLESARLDKSTKFICRTCQVSKARSAYVTKIRPEICAACQSDRHRLAKSREASYQKAKKHDYYMRNKAHLAAKNQAWARAHQELVRKYKAKWRHRNHLYDREYYVRNKETILSACREYRKLHAARIREYQKLRSQNVDVRQALSAQKRLYYQCNRTRIRAYFFRKWRSDLQHSRASKRQEVQQCRPSYIRSLVKQSFARWGISAVTVDADLVAAMQASLLLKRELWRLKNAIKNTGK